MRSVFAVPGDDPDLLQAQVQALSTRIPLMYGLVAINTAAVSWTHLHVAPAFLTLYLPGLMILATFVRAVQWDRRRRLAFDPVAAAAMMRGVMIVAPALGLVFPIWALSLMPYGDAQMQSQIAIYLSVTLIACSLCLMHLKTAPGILLAMVIVPFIMVFSQTGNRVDTAVALNILLVGVLILFLLRRNYDDFVSMIVQRRVLVDKQAETQMLSDENFMNANIDMLTGLPNRRYFFAELGQKMATARRDGSTLAVGVVDLDGFKPINDIYGHATGDDLLALVGQRLADVSTRSIFLARLGGDEFGMIVEHYADNAELAGIGETVAVALRAPFDFQMMTVQLGASVGFASFPEAAETAEDLFERADYALYHAKQHNKGGVVLFAAEHETAIHEASHVVQALRAANLQEELWVAYQPIVDVDTGMTYAMEALARWNNCSLGPVSPAVFIPSAERSGMMSQLTPVLLRKALADACDWPGDVRLSFNLSVFDICSPASILGVLAIVRESGFPPSRLDFEVTETAVMLDFDQARDGLNALKALGARISLDDFGTGYSSLSCVRQLPLDKIKVDRSFVIELENDPAGRQVVRTIVDLCRNLDFDCVVEGVETEAQKAILREQGCRLMQGYFFSKPIPSAGVADHFTRHGPHSIAPRAMAS
ncbi:EAL domain-containing protein [Phreatobacter aquaticus]|uniref:EAL domain-containing protein n=1 Tax=Phreatobacter aquaticus TaxID=2570229 RepID=A0A4D7QJT5_9HYPH|nr:EAL domain-containing protein [Phreatobacter aquaticus]QCK85566.1 EAL domain-containing protein [Phreatobacter aquaticus]